MAKIMVFQHVPYEPLGTLDPLIRSHKHRIRYINFGRDPHAQPDIQGYDALIILGGPMNIGDEAEFPHLNVEKAVILDAISKDIPILGICLGAQLIASALGASVRPAQEKEIGWYQMRLTDKGKSDPVFDAFQSAEDVFQWHGYTFDLPEGAELLVEGNQIKNQAFRYNDKVYGFQFHLEASMPLIKRWLNLPAHQAELGLDNAPEKIASIWRQTQNEISRSLALSEEVFGAFLSKLPRVNEKHHFVHRHF
ncbi:type 1 glutamine amidotransferase [Aliikangiella sp. G2MR2-5]|uniref:type 1 glutamine amidotransferase n=1 Tax=Aliikangiella sp. G2MR2-5 TaxID=2788943 RepID=UPI001AED3D1A|nr:type 1 glutamine amidotransferase [Aliikangiella sp. G2MR2-5]